MKHLNISPSFSSPCVQAWSNTAQLYAGFMLYLYQISFRKHGTHPYRNAYQSYESIKAALIMWPHSLSWQLGASFGDMHLRLTLSGSFTFSILHHTIHLLTLSLSSLSLSLSVCLSFTALILFSPQASYPGGKGWSGSAVVPVVESAAGGEPAANKITQSRVYRVLHCGSNRNL